MRGRGLGIIDIKGRAANRNPFDAVLLPDSVTILVTYGFNSPMREALAKVLTGKAEPAGTLPVDLP